jgi:hypothetical protein
MKTPNFILRLLTLLIYFLPFIFFVPTCTDMLTFEQAYNKADAIKNQQTKTEYEISNFNLLLDSIKHRGTKDAFDELQARSQEYIVTSNQMKYLDQDLQFYLIMPTNHSLSGLGAIIYHKNLLGKITIAISFGLSFLTLFFWTFLDKWRIGKIFVVANISFLGVFILGCVFSDVTILFGTWTLLFVLVAQLVTKDNRAESAYR